MREKVALFPGVFDPPHLGHLDIIGRAAKMFDHLYVGIGKNLSKADRLFTNEESQAMLQSITDTIPNVEVVCFSGLVMDFAKKKRIRFLIRALRGMGDIEREFQMAFAHRSLGRLETVFLMANPRYCHLSSSLVREVGHYSSHLHDFVPQALEEIVYQRVTLCQNQTNP